jgi:alpha-galactosidase
MGWRELRRWDGYVTATSCFTLSIIEEESQHKNEEENLHGRFCKQNNWNTFACSVSSNLLLDTSKLLTEYGLQDLGYKYVVLDDCWSSGRDDNGKLVADSDKFPDGMGAVADALHEQGFLFGMYSSAGEMTCARYGEICRR